MPSLWIVNHYAGFPETVPATRTFELARQLSSVHGWEVTVLACSFSHYTFVDDHPEWRDTSTEVVRDGVRWVFIRSTRYRQNGPARFLNMLTFSRRVRRWAHGAVGPDVVVGTTVHPFAAEAARRVAARNGARFVYEITDLWPESLVDLGRTSRSSLLYRRLFELERRALTRAAGVIGLMPGVPDYARELHGLALQDFCYVPNGIRLTPDLVGQPVDVERGAVVYAGGFARAHGLDVVITAATELHRRHAGRFTIHMYGDGPERPRLERQAAEAGLTNVVFYGLVPKIQLPDILRRAEICLCTGESLPVHRFGMSFNKLFDYFNAARPVVFAVDSSNDAVQESGAGLSVPAGDGKALAGAIAEIGQLEPRDQEAMGMRGAKYVQREHSFDVLGRRLDAFLRDVLEAPRLGLRSPDR
jgi:glycosyltransferase involved in cell wall biosynthesis